MLAKKILVSGPESSGKTSLCQYLLAHISGAVLRPEIARSYLEMYGPDYTLQDLQLIWQRQIEEEQRLEKDHPIVICDTAHFVIGAWNDAVFKDPSLTFTQLWRDYPTKYDLILLCQSDLPWEPDPLRASPSIAVRQQLYEQYAQEMQRRDLAYHAISGKGQLRYEKLEMMLRKAGF